MGQKKMGNLFFTHNSFSSMAPKYKKHDPVMVLATRFDMGSEDRNGDLFSVVHARAGLGLYAHGTVTHVYSLSSKPIQTYKIKYDDDGGQYPSVEAHVLPEPADGDESASEEEDPPPTTTERSTTPPTSSVLMKPATPR